MTTCTRYPCGGTRHGCPMDDCPGRRDATALADELIAWVESYAKKVCPDGCLPTPGQEREISMFARITRALRAAPQTPDAVLTELKVLRDIGDHTKGEHYKVLSQKIHNAVHRLTVALSTPSASAETIYAEDDWPERDRELAEWFNSLNLGERDWDALMVILSGASAGPQAEAVNEPTPNWQRRWPHDQPNGWNLDGAAFLKLVQENPMLWLSLGRAKYLELRVDTRDGGFNLYDRDRKPLNPDDVVEAAAKTKAQFGEVAHPQPQQADGRGAVIEECIQLAKDCNLKFYPHKSSGILAHQIDQCRADFVDALLALQQSPATDNAPAVSSRAQERNTP